MTALAHDILPAAVIPSRRVEIRDLAALRFAGDIAVDILVAKHRHAEGASRDPRGTRETFHGHGFTGAELLTSAIETVLLDDSAAPPTLTVVEPWTLDGLYEVCRLACAYGLHELTGHTPPLDPILDELTPFGLEFATPRCPPEMRAAHLAAGGSLDPDAPNSYERLCAQTAWSGTTFRFEPETGTLTILAHRGP